MDEKTMAVATLMKATEKGPGTMPIIGAARSGPDPKLPVGEEQLAEAAELLRKYKDGKSALENRVVEDELWWELRNWETQRRKMSEKGRYKGPEPSSAWLFNTLLNKHADVMDNYPEPVVLPREKSDEASAKVLTEILPVVLEQNKFDQTYSDQSWEKLKHGTAVYGIFWSSKKENGLGDIEIRGIDLLKIFWEPGITDIQRSSNLFIVDLVDTAILERRYPQYKGRLASKTIDIKQYYYNNDVDTTEKSVVVDWYYKVEAKSGKTLLHYVKFCGDCLLYASENEPEYAERGYYDHGLYPVVFDTLFPEKGTPVGFGYVAVTKDPQMYIDRMSANILESSMMATKKRFFVSTSTNVSPEQFADWNQRLVPVEGELSESRIQEITVAPISGTYLNVMTQKIEELKDTAGNRDVNSGGTGSGVTAAAAIAALQEAGNKTSRDMIAASYRAHKEISAICLELMRQFYDESRCFRVVGDAGAYQYVSFTNKMIADKPIGESGGQTLYRRPTFDLKIKSQKRNPFSRMEQNERAKELYGLGFFNPERAQEAITALDMMDFEGVETIRDKVRQGETLMNVTQKQQELLQQQAEEIKKLTELVARLTGREIPDPAQETAPAPQQRGERPETGKRTAVHTVSPDSLTRETMKAHTPMTAYGDRLAKRSTPDLEA